METFNQSMFTAGDEIETEIISSDDMARMVEVNSPDLGGCTYQTQTETSPKVPKMLPRTSSEPQIVSPTQEEPLSSSRTGSKSSLQFHFAAVHSNLQTTGSRSTATFHFSSSASSITLSIPTHILQRSSGLRPGEAIDAPTEKLPARKPPPRKILPTSSTADVALTEQFSGNVTGPLAFNLSDYLRPFPSPPRLIQKFAKNVGLTSSVTDGLVAAKTGVEMQSPVRKDVLRSDAKVQITLLGRLPAKLPIPSDPAKTEFRYSMQNPSTSQRTERMELSESTESVHSNSERKPCRCSRSFCLKLYCDCFNLGEICSDECSCKDCFNNADCETERSDAVRVILQRNPKAFKSRDAHIGETHRSRTKGCHCKKSACRKNYCECYLGKTACGELCLCVHCENPASKWIATSTLSESGHAVVRPTLTVVQDEDGTPMLVSDKSFPERSLLHVTVSKKAFAEPEKKNATSKHLRRNTLKRTKRKEGNVNLDAPAKNLITRTSVRRLRSRAGAQ